MNYITIKDKIDNNTIKYKFIKSDESKLTYAEFIQLLVDKNEDFIRELDYQLSQAPVELSPRRPVAFFWECVPVSQDTLNREFEFVAIRSEVLDNITCDYSSFNEHFRRSEDNHVVSFSSLSGDTLVVPMPNNEMQDYKNLREFNSNASMEQKERFWQKVGEKMEEKLLEANGNPRWLSTSGLGVSYLHVRIDKRPKYYSFDEYRNFHFQSQRANVQQHAWQQWSANWRQRNK